MDLVILPREDILNSRVMVDIHSKGDILHRQVLWVCPIHMVLPVVDLAIHRRLEEAFQQCLVEGHLGILQLQVVSPVMECSIPHSHSSRATGSSQRLGDSPSSPAINSPQALVDFLHSSRATDSRQLLGDTRSSPAINSPLLEVPFLLSSRAMDSNQHQEDTISQVLREPVLLDILVDLEPSRVACLLQVLVPRLCQRVRELFDLKRRSTQNLMPKPCARR